MSHRRLNQDLSRLNDVLRDQLARAQHDLVQAKERIAELEGRAPDAPRKPVRRSLAWIVVATAGGSLIPAAILGAIVAPPEADWAVVTVGITGVVLLVVAFGMWIFGRRD